MHISGLVKIMTNNFVQTGRGLLHENKRKSLSEKNEVWKIDGCKLG